jgi:hypothetical protein
VRKAFIGFYWTLPVNWAGFRNLDVNVDAAATASRTIRYQRECVRRYAAADNGRLVHEITFLDTQPDRATDGAMQKLEQCAAAFVGTGATILVVSFEEIHQWRRNPYVAEAARRLGLNLVSLPPEPINIDGKMFDPTRHFEQWRKWDASARSRFRLEALAGVQAACAATPEGRNRWRAIADSLNDSGVKSNVGRTWTAESVRKFVGRLQPNKP